MAEVGRSRINRPEQACWEEDDGQGIPAMLSPKPESSPKSARDGGVGARTADLFPFSKCITFALFGVFFPFCFFFKKEENYSSFSHVLCTDEISSGHVLISFFLV